jgi:hypothetical protein
MPSNIHHPSTNHALHDVLRILLKKNDAGWPGKETRMMKKGQRNHPDRNLNAPFLSTASGTSTRQEKIKREYQNEERINSPTKTAYTIPTKETTNRGRYQRDKGEAKRSCMPGSSCDQTHNTERNRISNTRVIRNQTWGLRKPAWETEQQTEEGYHRKKRPADPTSEMTGFSSYPERNVKRTP